MNKTALLTLCLLPALAWADDFSRERLDNWHQWRGPEATGVAPRGDPPLRWDEKTHVKWKTPIPGRGSSTPIVWGDRIFLLTAVDTGRAADPNDVPKVESRLEKKTKAPMTYHQFLVIAVDRATGKIRWQQLATEQVPHEGIHPTHSYAAFSPTTDGQYLYVFLGSRGLYCYDLTGKLQWQRDLGRMDTRYGWGEGSSPVVHGDTLIVNWDHEGASFLIALDTRTGNTKWKVHRDEVSSWATPLVVADKTRTQVIVNGAKRVRSYDLATGKVIWECGGQTINVIPSPVADDRLVYCMSGYRGSAADAIPLDSSGDVTGKAVWHHDRGTPYVPSPLLVDGRLYFTHANSNLMTCLDARTGKVRFDRERLPGLTTLYASPTATRDRIYVVDRDGTALVLRQGDKIEVLAVNRLGEGVDASPVIVGKQLFLRGEHHLFCIAE